jgi:hypothetical protein
MRRKFITTVTAVALAVSMAACSSGGDDDDESSGTTTTEVEDTATTAGPDGSESTTTTAGGSGTTTTTAGGGSGTTTTTTARSVCTATRGWNTRPDSEATNVLSTEAIYLLNAGRHDDGCYDQLTFVLNGNARVGFHTAYAEGSDVADDETRMPTVGDAALQVDIMAPNLGGPYDTSGSTHRFGARGDILYSTSNPRGLRVIEEVKAVGEFESVATFAVGVDRQRPFAVTTGINRDGNRVVIIRVAH